jgi:hypothetical protein
MTILVLFALLILIVYSIGLRNGFKWKDARTKKALFLTMGTWLVASILAVILFSFYSSIRRHNDILDLGFNLLLYIIPGILYLIFISIPMIIIHFIVNYLSNMNKPITNNIKYIKNGLVSGLLGLMNLLIISILSSTRSIGDMIQERSALNIIGLSFGILFVSGLISMIINKKYIA